MTSTWTLAKKGERRRL